MAPFLDGWAVSDAENHAIRYLSGGTVQTLNCSAAETGLPTSGGAVAFSYPTGLAARSGSLYVSDTHQGAIRKIAPDGSVTTFASGLAEPMGLCWSDGALYVAETGANRIVKIVNGEVFTVAGSGQEGAADGPAAQASFALPQHVAVDGDTIYVSDTGNGAVRCIRDGEVTTLFSRGLAMDREDILYPASPAGLLAVGGNLYVCDSFNQAVYVIAL